MPEVAAAVTVAVTVALTPVGEAAIAVAAKLGNVITEIVTEMHSGNIIQNNNGNAKNCDM